MPKWISVEEAGGQVWNQQRSNLALGGYEKIPDVV